MNTERELSDAVRDAVHLLQRCGDRSVAVGAELRALCRVASQRLQRAHARTGAEKCAVRGCENAATWAQGSVRTCDKHDPLLDVEELEGAHP